MSFLSAPELGDVYGKLTIMARHSNIKKFHTYLCICECGTSKLIRKYPIIQGVTRSCGCYQREVSKNALVTHGMTKSFEYSCYRNMLARCNNPSHDSYAGYGGRGITVCNFWKESFQNFIDEMGPAPSRSHSIERINNDLGYCIENCKWATSKEQAINKRLRADNITGKVGVSLDLKRGIPFYKASLKLPNGTLLSKLFSCRKYGIIEAMILACRQRDIFENIRKGL